jgi:hypothetical protein
MPPDLATFQPSRLSGLARILGLAFMATSHLVSSLWLSTRQRLQNRRLTERGSSSWKPPTELSSLRTRSPRTGPDVFESIRRTGFSPAHDYWVQISELSRDSIPGEQPCRCETSSIRTHGYSLYSKTPIGGSLGTASITHPREKSTWRIRWSRPVLPGWS